MGSGDDVSEWVIRSQQRGNERVGKLRHDSAPVARAELPGAVTSMAQRKLSQDMEAMAAIRYEARERKPASPMEACRNDWF